MVGQVVQQDSATTTMAGDFTSEKVLDQTTIADPNVCTSNFADEDKTPPQNSIDDQDMVKSEETGSIDKDVPPFELTGLPLALVMTGLGLSIFVMSLDGSIIATAIPRITSQFNSTGDIGWYGSAYTFAMCALQPICGKLFSSFALKVCAAVNMSHIPQRACDGLTRQPHRPHFFPSSPSLSLDRCYAHSPPTARC